MDVEKQVLPKLHRLLARTPKEGGSEEIYPRLLPFLAQFPELLLFKSIDSIISWLKEGVQKGATARYVVEANCQCLAAICECCLLVLTKVGLDSDTRDVVIEHVRPTLQARSTCL